jgi:hypothetical protein
VSTFDATHDFLAHYGVKGMRWGVRRPSTSAEPAGNDSANAAARKARVKKVAISAGVLAVAAGGAYVTYKLAKDGKLPIKSLNRASVIAGKQLVEKVNNVEPTSVIHGSRGKDVGFRFIKRGGVPDPMTEYMQAFDGHTGGDHFKRFGDGKIAARFSDPEGRRDFAGRIIPHEVIIPKSMTDGINSLDDVVKNIWPTLKPEHDAMYLEEGSIARREREAGNS